MTADAWKSGVELDGFTLGEVVHAGGMGTLFHVTKPGFSQPLVMKLPRLGPDQPSEAIIGFETEATISPTLKGPHAPACVAVGDLTSTPYLVFEFVEGECLEQRMATGPLPALEVASVGAALADGLACRASASGDPPRFQALRSCLGELDDFDGHGQRGLQRARGARAEAVTPGATLDGRSPRAANDAEDVCGVSR
jgi:hypothetical protein